MLSQARSPAGRPAASQKHGGRRPGVRSAARPAPARCGSPLRPLRPAPPLHAAPALTAPVAPPGEDTALLKFKKRAWGHAEPGWHAAYCKWCPERASGRGAGRVWVHIRRAEGGRATFDSRSAAPLGAAALAAAASASPCSSARAARAKRGLRAMSMKLTCIIMPRNVSDFCHHLLLLGVHASPP